MRSTLIAAALAALAACAGAPPSGGPAPDFVLRDLSGKSVRLSDFRGHPVLVDFWATWCVPCRESIPAYGKLTADRRLSGFTVIGIDEDDLKTDVAAFAKANAVAYPLLRDPNRRAFDAFRVRGLPTAVLIDASGNVVRRWDSFNAGTMYEVGQALDEIGSKK